MGELASLRETLAPFQGRDEVEKLQSELARLRESAQEAAKRIAEAGSSRSTPTMRDGHHRQGTPSHPAVTAEHRQGTGGVQHHTDQELGCSADLVYGKEDGRFEPMMGSRTADADQVGVLGEGGSRTGAGDSADSQHQRHQQQEREQEGVFLCSYACHARFLLARALTFSFFTITMVRWCVVTAQEEIY